MMLHYAHLHQSSCRFSLTVSHAYVMFFHNLTCDANWNHNHTMLLHLARGGLVTLLSLVSHKVSFPILSQMEFVFLETVASGLLRWGHIIFSNIIDLTVLTLLDEN